MTDQAPINLFVPVFRTEEVLNEIRDCLERGWTGLGYKTVEFEEAWKAYTGLPHAHFVNSGTAALHLAVALLKRKHGWKDGDEVITTPLTFVSTNHVILYEKLHPVFADTDPFLCLDPESVRNRITSKTRAVMFVGYGGNAGRLDDIRSLCLEKHLALIVDGAHMAGTRIYGRHVGHHDDVITFSFHSVKNLPTADGGMVCFADEDLDAEARKASWLGINRDTYSRMGSAGTYKWLYDVEHEGWKYHGNSIMAAIALVGLRYLDQDNAYRRQIAIWYDELLHNQPEIDLFPVLPGCEISRHLYPIQVDDRDELMVFLNAANIFPGVHYRINTDYPMYRYAQGTCPNAERAAKRLISLPLHLKMTRTDVERVAWWISDFFGKRP
jgi:dTDP-4-amino-4,6-dideoxygalactose transaminase